MKRLILITAFLTFALNVQSQKITKEFLIGKWESNSDNIEFFITNKKDFNIVSYSYLTGNYFKILGYQFNKGSFYLRSLHEPNNWESIGKFFIIDENTIVADYVSNAPGQTIYKRVINK
jgi:hypothetical protein